MRHLVTLTVLLAAMAAPAVAADRDDRTRRPADTIILSDPARGTTVGRVGGAPVLLQDTANGTVGKVGKDKVMVHKDGYGNTLGKVGDRKLFCHTDPASGLTLCK
jgi:hypothetical protein